MIWVLLICLVTTFYYYMKKKFTFFSSIGIPHQPGSFPLGSNVTWKMVKGKLPFIKICDEIYNEFKDDAKIAGYYGLFGTPTFVAIDEDLIKKILIKDFDHFLDRRSFPLHPETNKYAMKMVSIMEGKEWKDARNQMSPIFTSTRMKGIMPVVHEVGDSFINYLNRSELNKDNLNAKELTQLCVVETLGRIGCGVKPNILDDKEPYNNAFYQEFKSLTGQQLGGSGIMFLIRVVLLYFAPKIFYLMKFEWLPKETANYFATLIRNSIKLRQDTGARMNDFIDYLTDVAKNKDGEMEDDEDDQTEYDKGRKLEESSASADHFMKNEDLECNIISTGMLLFLAGTDTTSTTLSIVLHFLANEQDLQEQVYQEIKDAIDENGGNNHLSYAKMTELKHLEAFVKESLRFLGFNELERVCTKNYFIPELNVTLPKGSVIQIPASSLMHLEKHYPNPSKFDPEGHFDNRILNPNNFYGFGQGPRSCVGFRFAWTMLRATLVNVLSHFKIMPGPNNSKLDTNSQAFLTSQKLGAHVKLEPRN